MRFELLIARARNALDQLRRDGHPVEAETLQRLIVSRSMSRNTNRQLYQDNLRLRALLTRAHDALSRPADDAMLESDWDQLIADITGELAI